ncbi:MAG: D-alanine--D-alanine ligase, partial [Bacteroidota bacterium]|nr:D-alanine--D-alanine ligase [Bacteroidota bacterium]
MEVALVYNLKKDGSDSNNGERPSSQNIIDVSTQVTGINSKGVYNKSVDTYAEWDTIETITAVRDALASRHSVTMIEADDEVFGTLRSSHPDIVFNIAEGRSGASRESQIPALLEMLNLPYTGSDPLTLGICLDKSRAKEILSYHRIPTPKFTVVHSLSHLRKENIFLPAIVKPLFEGSSKGIFNSSFVQTVSDLYEQVERILNGYDEPALTEEFLPGREFTVAMLGNGNSLQVLPIVEINFDSLPDNVNPIYSFEAKWIWDEVSNPLDIFTCPARMSPPLQSAIEKVCRDAFTVLRCRDWCRID